MDWEDLGIMIRGLLHLANSYESVEYYYEVIAEGDGVLGTGALSSWYLMPFRRGFQTRRLCTVGSVWPSDFDKVERLNVLGPTSLGRVLIWPKFKIRSQQHNNYNPLSLLHVSGEAANRMRYCPIVEKSIAVESRRVLPLSLSKSLTMEVSSLVACFIVAGVSSQTPS